ncbi:alkaline phosphatase [Hyphococcus formosus]|uniref:alkaline phosphatase n=1 Tax=Hyphococcus formosus TaxID=3143534 RepID=UPI00398BBB7A
MLKYAALLLCSASLGACAQTAALTKSSQQAAAKTGDYWYDGAQTTLAERKAIKANKSKAKNVILFVADGMDPTTVAAARIYDGQSRGEDGEENLLSFERFPYLAMSKTYNTDMQTPDSAGTMTAMATGYKTKAGIISLDNTAERSDCASSLDAHAPTIVELAERAGMATGVVSTARLTHATPAATYAHAADRDWENDTRLPDGAYEMGCRDIASQLIDFEYGDGVDLALGGGRSNFLPQDFADPEDQDKSGARKDGRNLAAEWMTKSNSHVFIWNEEQFNRIDPSTDPKILGLFERSHMKYELDRPDDSDGEPSLEAMTKKAIEILSRNENGYVLVIEAGRVDHAHHGGNAARALADTQEFAQAIAAARTMTDQADTLVIATADHGHTISFAGYPAKGNDILGFAAMPDDDGELEPMKALDGKPYTTLGYANGPGAVFNKSVDLSDGRPALDHDEIAHKDFQQQALVPSYSETHGGQDVTIYASGPGAYLFGGVVEQNYIFHVIDDALRLRSRAGE